jgi:transposase
MTYSDLENRALVAIYTEISLRRYCELSHVEVAARAGVSRSTVRKAIMKAEKAGELLVARRVGEGDTNHIRLPKRQVDK